MEPAEQREADSPVTSIIGAKIRAGGSRAGYIQQACRASARGVIKQARCEVR